MKTVTILVSTYNGEKYIKAQIDSLINQTYPNIRIYIRDDGSTDNTLSVIKREYSGIDNVKIYSGKNIGYGRSFLRLLKEAEYGDYWAFCDQDDVWDTGKICRAVSKLDEMAISTPNMYVHDYYITDEQLYPVRRYVNEQNEVDFRMAITECKHMGFSTVFNKEFRKYMLEGNINRISSHDWWAELIVMEFGTLFVDDYVGAWHRRLESSVSENNLHNRFAWFLRALKGNSEIPYITKEFYKTFYCNMKIEDRRILALFVNDRYSFINSLTKALYPRRWRTSMASEIVVRLLMIIGKI